MLMLFIIEILIFVTLTALVWFLGGRHLVNYLDKLTKKKDEKHISPLEFQRKIAEMESRINELEKEEENESNLKEAKKLHSELSDLKKKLGELEPPR